MDQSIHLPKVTWVAMLLTPLINVPLKMNLIKHNTVTACVACSAIAKIEVTLIVAEQVRQA